jgi:hypothetical protein
MAALHVISSLLFNGGKGEWLQWLGVAYNFVDSILRLGLPRGLGYFLTHCSEDIRYIFKTAMWFDVLASICLFQSPHFLLVYRQLFQPPDAHINNLPAVIQPELSMMSVMGCENHVVWAMAEVTALLAWKESQQRQGCLSIPALVERGLRIEKHILCRSGPPLPPKNDIHYHRYVTSDVFRASTRVYLHSVLSGDFPNCPEIMESVDDTIRCLKRVSEMGSGVFGNRSSRSVVRSVVFSIFICGCLTDDLEKRKYLLDCLTAQTAETVGNCPEVKDLMEDVWAVPRTPDEPVLWRLQLRESGILLV